MSTTKNATAKEATVAGHKVTGEFRMVKLAGLLHLKLLQRAALTESDVADLAASLQKEGQIAPIVLCNDTATILAEERRVAAARVAGWVEIAAIVTAIKPESPEAYSLSAAENRERSEINWIAQADYYMGLLKRKVFKNGKELAAGLGISAPIASQYLTCAKHLTAEEKQKAAAGKLTFKAGYKLAAERAKATRTGNAPGRQAPERIPAVSLDEDKLLWQPFAAKDEAGNTGALIVEIAIPCEERPSDGKAGWAWVIEEIRALLGSYEERMTKRLAAEQAEKEKEEREGDGAERAEDEEGGAE